MKALLICPAQRETVAALAENVPLAAAPILGKTLIEYWLEHFAALGAKEIFISAADRPEMIFAKIGDGARWGLRAEIFPAIGELSPAAARAKFRIGENANWFSAPDDVALMEHLPLQPQFPLFTNYAAWFAAIVNWLPRAATPDRIGVREIKPGVWLGLRARVAASAELRAPCWLGKNVFVGDGAVVGPLAVIEDRAFIEAGAKISESIVGPETFVGGFAEIHQSLAFGDTLVNWKWDSCLKVPDAFLLSPLKPKPSSRPAFARLFAPPPLEPLWKFNAKSSK